MIKVTQTNGNSANKIYGSRIRIWAKEKIVDEFTVPTKSAKYYCLKHPTGRYGKRYFEALEKARKIEESFS